MNAPIRDNADRFGPVRNVPYPVLSKFDGAPFFYEDGAPSMAYWIGTKEDINRFAIGPEPDTTDTEVAAFDILRQAWLV